MSVPINLMAYETDLIVHVCATLSLNAEFDITVTLATSDGTGMCVQQLALNSLCEQLCFLQLQMVPTTRECPWTWSSLLVLL